MSFVQYRSTPTSLRPFRKPLFVALLVLLCVSPGHAAEEPDQPKQDLTELSLEQLMEVEVPTVVGASRYEQKVDEAPAAVSIVTGDEIRRYGYRSLAEALNSVRGLYLTYDRNYHFLGVRGFNRPGDYNSRILLLVDGHRINDNIFESAAIGTEFPVDIDLIDRIEVIRGPGSSLYGTNAFFGVINIITRSAGELQGAEAAAAAGSFETYNGRGTYGREFGNGAALLLSASAMHGEGAHRLFFPEFARPSLHDGTAVGLDGDRNYQLFAKGVWRDFTLTGALSSRTKEVPTGSFGTVFGVPGSQTTDRYGLVDLKYSRGFGARGEVTARLFYDRFEYRGNYILDRNNPDNTADPVDPQLVLNKDLALGSWWGAEGLYTRKLGGMHKVTLGAEYRENLTQHQQNFDADPFQRNLDDRRSSTIWALFLQDEARLLKSLILSAGVRYDHYGTFGGAVNPRVGLIYEPFTGSIFKLLYGEAFRAPSAYELYYADGASGTANPGLKAEKVQTYEVVYEQYFREHLRSSISGFHYRIRDLITQVPLPDATTQYQNLDTVEANGVELELEGRWQRVQARGSYTWQRAEDATTGRHLSNSPEHLAKLNLVLPVYRDYLSAGIEEQYGGSRLTKGGTTSGYYLTNLTLLSREVLPGLECSFSVYNLLDRRYSVPASPNHAQESIAQDGRTYRVKIQYLF